MMDGWNGGQEGISINQIEFLSSSPHYSTIPMVHHSMQSRTEMTNSMTKAIQNWLGATLTVEKNSRRVRDPKGFGSVVERVVGLL